MSRLNEEQIHEEIAKLSDWKFEDGRWIVKRFRFTDFLKGIQFVNRIAELSEEIQHHPFITIEYKVVTIQLTSWRAKGLTKLDCELADKYDAIYNQISNK